VTRSGDTVLAVVRGDDPGVVPGVVTDTSRAVADGRDLGAGPAPGVSPPAAR
jgi:hypothetical protein